MLSAAAPAFCFLPEMSLTWEAKGGGRRWGLGNPGFRRLALSETKPNNRMENQHELPRANFGAGDSSDCWASQAQHQPTKAICPTYRLRRQFAQPTGFRRLALSETKPNNRMENQHANFGASDSSQCWASPSAQHQPTKAMCEGVACNALAAGRGGRPPVHGYGFQEKEP